MFETIPINVFTIYMSNFNLVNMGKLQMVLLLSLLRTTTVTKLMVNTNCKELSVQLLCWMIARDDVKSVIVTHVG